MKNDVLHEIANIGRSLIRIAEILREDPKELIKTTVETQVTKEEPDSPAHEPSTSPTCTFIDLKKAFHNLSEKGMDAAAIALLAEFGCSKLSQIAEKDYATLKQKAEDILNA